jgi:hypothetical protein
MTRKLLYITAIQPQGDKPALTEAARSIISIRASNFGISLAVEGPHRPVLKNGIGIGCLT